MSSILLFSVVLCYFGLLLLAAWYAGKGSTNESFFIGNRNSNWILVAFGMIGTSLSGVTFVSVPGTVQANGFYYLQVVLGYLVGYVVVAFVLIPLYYRMNLTSIYHFLYVRLGMDAYKIGALLFIISRTVGATARLYLVINVLQIFILNDMQVPFWLTTSILLLMILMYTFKGGVKTIVLTDTLQTTCMLIGLLVCAHYLLQALHLSPTAAFSFFQEKGYTKLFNTDVSNKKFFLKQIVGGAFITIAMTGLDQEMMQKNISVKTKQGAQKNMMSFSLVMAFVNFLFLFLGGLLYTFAASKNITVKNDDLFPFIALHFLPKFVGLIFIIGLISALFPSADGALTALTSSFCIDILGIQRNNQPETTQKKIRKIVHVSFTAVFFLAIGVFKLINSKSIINDILDLAGYTYGPLLGLFTFGLFMKNRSLRSGLTTGLACLSAPLLSYYITNHISTWTGGFQIGIELLPLNGVFTFVGLLLASTDNSNKTILSPQNN